MNPLQVTVKNVTLTLEEELLCKALKFAGITKSDSELEQIDESAFEAQRALITATATATRYNSLRCGYTDTLGYCKNCHCKRFVNLSAVTPDSNLQL